MGREEMRGLQTFISDIRACKSDEAELKRINKELANIRSKFGDKKQINGYQKKKYVAKLVFVFLLGHDVEFGHLEAVNLLSSMTLSEKQIGYLFSSVMLHEGHELMKVVIQAIKNDLGTRSKITVCLALNCIANIGGKETAREVMPNVIRLLVAPQSPTDVQRKAALCALQLLRAAPDTFPHGEHTATLIQLLTSPDMGVVMSVASLLTALASANPKEYAGVVAVAANRLHRVVMNGAEKPYTYYWVPAPWLTVKLLRLLQIFPAPKDASVERRVRETLSRLIERAKEMPPATNAYGQPVKPKIQYFNANNACLFEAVNLLAVYDTEPDLQVKTCTLLGNFLVHKEVNMRMLALEGLGVMSSTTHSSEAVKKHRPTVIKALHKEKDAMTQNRAVDLLYELCDTGSVQEVVGELLDFLDVAEYKIRESLVLKVAIAAEKYAADFAWYVDVMLRLIRSAGDYVAEQVWHRVVQVILNRPDVQAYAAKTCYEALLDPSAQECMVCVGGYVLGEFGHLIANDPNSVPPKQLEVIKMHYPMVSAETRALLLSVFVKLANLFPEIKPVVKELLSAPGFVRNGDAELQQRANEYVQLLSVEDPAILPNVLEEMPPFTEQQCSVLTRLEEKKETGEAAEKTGTLAAKKRVAKPMASVSAASVAGVTGTPAAAVGGVGAAAAGVPADAVGNADWALKFLLVNQGVLYENPVMQIGAKCEFRANMGRITLFYGNQSPDTGFTNVSCLAMAEPALKVHPAPLPDTIGAGEQIQQQISIECLQAFIKPPSLIVKLSYQGRPVTLNLTLPATINKFVGPLPNPLSKDTFFAKWSQLSGEGLEQRQIIKAKKPITATSTSETMLALGIPPLSNVDPKPENVVGAAILNTTGGAVGILARAEPSTEAKLVRVTVRSSTATSSTAIVNCFLGQL